MRDLTKTISQCLSLLVGFIFIVLIKSGFTFNLSGLSTWIFWLEVAVKEFVLLGAFNIVYDLDKRNRVHNKKSNYYKQMGIHQKNVEKIHKEHLFSKLDEAVKKENAEREADEMTRILRKATVRVSADDLPKEDEEIDCNTWVQKIARKYKLSDKTAKKLHKRAEQVFDGKYKVAFMNGDDILADYAKENNRSKKEARFSAKKILVIHNVQKGSTCLVSTIVLTCVSFLTVSPDEILTTLITNSLLLLSAFISGINSSIQSIKLHANYLTHQNLFLSKQMGLHEDFRPTQEN